jgi:hypothetical protein
MSGRLETVPDFTTEAQHGYSYDRPPGTEVVDISGKEEHIHYPMPTNDPSDPLNWSRTWKVSLVNASRLPFLAVLLLTGSTATDLQRTVDLDLLHHTYICEHESGL